MCTLASGRFHRHGCCSGQQRALEGRPSRESGRAWRFVNRSGVPYCLNFGAKYGAGRETTGRRRVVDPAQPAWLALGGQDAVACGLGVLRSRHHRHRAQGGCGRVGDGAHDAQVIPEGAGPVKRSPGRFCRLSAGLCARRGRRRGQSSGEARPRRGRRALRPAPFGACCGQRTRTWGSRLLAVGALGFVALVRTGVPVGGSAAGGCSSSLRRAGRRHDGVRRPSVVGVNQRGRPRRMGVMTCATRGDRVRWS